MKYHGPIACLGLRLQVGSALFTAPEVILNVQAQPYEGEPVDVWSCGVVGE